MSHLLPGEELDEVVGICRDLIRIDTSNYGSENGPGERVAAEYVAAKLDEVGIHSELHEAQPRRSNLFARVPGRSGPALLVHGHLDVVPADHDQWTVAPFAGEIIDDYLWGRGAIDMKHMVAMVLAAVRQIKRKGIVPEREIALAFLADEENGFLLGSRWISEKKPDLVADCSEAISEVGGFSIQTRPEQRVYMIETARKGVAMMKLTATGRAGHGSLTNPGNSVGVLSRAVARIAEFDWPTLLTPTSTEMLTRLRSHGLPDVSSVENALGTALAPVASMLGSSLRHVANPTVLKAGGAFNVVPGQAEAIVDGRFVPGHFEPFMNDIADLAGPEVKVQIVDLTPADESTPGSGLMARMHASLLREDPGCEVIPYSSSASTDNASFASLGIQGYGFAPLKLPAGYDFSAMFHGVDERVPVEALKFGARVLYRFLVGAEASTDSQN